MDFIEKLTGRVRPERLKEKRFVDRRTCDIDVALKVGEAGEIFPGKIKDIGIYGIRVECRKPLKKDDEIYVQVQKGKGVFAQRGFRYDTVKGKVVWTRKKKISADVIAGLKFADTRSVLRDSWVFLLLSLYGFKADYKIQRRRSVRFPMNIRVRYNEPQGYYSGGGTLVDIGIGGIAMLTQTQIPDKVSLDLEWGPYGRLQTMQVRGEVAWSGYSRRDKTPIAGVTFNQLNDHQTKLLNRYIIAVLEEIAQK